MPPPHEPSRGPDLEKISVDGFRCLALKWRDETSAWRREVNYVFQYPGNGGTWCLLINCAPRIPVGSHLGSVRFYSPDEVRIGMAFLPAETTWDNGESDDDSTARLCPPSDFPDRRLEYDLETKIRHYMEGSLQLLSPAGASAPADSLQSDIRDIKHTLPSLTEAVGRIDKGVETLRVNTEAIAKNEFELRRENAALAALAEDGFLRFATRVDADDFRAFAAILLTGNRNKAAQELKIPLRTFYDRVESWLSQGPDHRRMYRMVEWRKATGRKIKLRMEDSLLGTDVQNATENPEVIRDVMMSIGDKDSERNREDLLRDILQALARQNPANWESVKTEVIDILREELSQ